MIIHIDRKEDQIIIYYKDYQIYNGFHKTDFSSHSLHEVSKIRSFFCSAFSFIRTEYEDLRSKSPYSVKVQENTDQKKLLDTFHVVTLIKFTSFSLMLHRAIYFSSPNTTLVICIIFTNAFIIADKEYF